MTKLSSLQVAVVRNHLQTAGLTGVLGDELLDHLCCDIEARLADGAAFDPAFKTTLATWPIAHLSGIRRKVYFTTQFKPMIFKLSAAVALAAGFFLLSPSSPEVIVCPTSPEPIIVFLETETFDPPTASPIAGADMKEILSSGYGMRTHPMLKKRMLHRGVDLKVKTGTLVQATAKGQVLTAGEESKYGITVRILHADGYVTVYAHLQSHAVEVGQEVALGEIIAAAGSTGASTAPHLHYEVLKDDVPVDPLALLD